MWYPPRPRKLRSIRCCSSVAALVPILLGAILTLVCAYGMGAMAFRKAPPEIALACGAALLSLPIFLIVLAGRAGTPAFLLLALAVCVAALRHWRHPWQVRDLPVKRLTSGEQRAALAIFGAYGVWCLVNALAPETTSDGVGYHLGLPFQYLRHGGFPSRMQFFDALPQGMEMLYTMAFAFGLHSAAKLVELAFFLATPWLMVRIGRRLGMTDLGGLVAAVLYFCAPVAGVTGSSSYTDAAMVFFTLAAFYCLLLWRENGETTHLAAAGLAAGFCYAIKLPGAFAVLGAGIFVIAARRSRALRPLLILAGGTAAVMAPWIVRDWILTGNPAAPLANGLFPNAYFHLLTEKELAADLSSWGKIQPLHVPWELAFGDAFTGTFGPLLWALPLGLAAWRSRAGRLCLAAALILALPWAANTGGRFLMPAVALAGLPLGVALARSRLSKPLCWAAIAMQAVLCWPQVLNAWQPDWVFRLHHFPLRAALRLEPEERYLTQTSPEYQVAKMLEHRTPPGSRTFSFDALASAYLARDVTVSWQSAEGDRLTDTLRLATIYLQATSYTWSANWPPALLRAVRFRLPASHSAEWDICETEFRSGEERVFNSPEWTLRAWPNPWETPAAIDGNPATRWRTWQPMRAGMFFEVAFDNPQRLTEAGLVSHTPAFRVPLEIYGQAPGGQWRLLSARASARPLPTPDLRLQATAALRGAGFQYLLAPSGAEGNGAIGRTIAADPLAWDMEKVGEFHGELLFRIR
jgi:4-amino-4-deoxy-L-arabinose transferase-like glycosyltransferase